MMHRLLLLLFFGFWLLLCSIPTFSAEGNPSSPPPYMNAPAPSTLASKIFWELNDALTLYQNAQEHPWPVIPDETRVLSLGTKNKAVLLLRERLKMTGDLSAENDTGRKYFDADLEDAVKVFQARHGMKADGVVGRDTRNALNIPPEVRVKQIAINMQRWANLSAQLGSRYVMVNIPDFHMYLIDEDRTVLTLKAIVGKRDLPTPELSSKITKIEFNPDWDIPDKIAQNDIAPKVLNDPDYLYRMHIRVFKNPSSHHEISPNNIDWESAAENGLNYHLRQDPGPDNALGLVKFEFQNTEDVYMHDTPAKNLFDVDIRDFSHGCIRLENPFALVEYLMKDDPDWNEQHMQEILDSGKPNHVKVTHPIPIFITYITAWVDDEGRLNFRDDIYQQDQS